MRKTEYYIRWLIFWILGLSMFPFRLCILLLNTIWEFFHFKISDKILGLTRTYSSSQGGKFSFILRLQRKLVKKYYV